MGTRPESYGEYYKAQLRDGQLYQDFVVDAAWHFIGLAIVQYASKEYQQVVGETKTGAEIKHDKQFRKKGRLWIEGREKARPRSGPYAPAGIWRDDNAWLFIIGDYDTIFLFSKRLLQILWGTDRYEKMPNRTETSIGMLLPLDDAEKYAAAIIRPNATEKIQKLAGDLRSTAAALHAAITQSESQGSLFTESERSN